MNWHEPLPGQQKWATNTDGGIASPSLQKLRPPGHDHQQVQACPQFARQRATQLSVSSKLRASNSGCTPQGSPPGLQQRAQAGWQGADANGLPDASTAAGRRLLQITASPGALGPACSVGPTCQSLDVTCKLSISQVGLLMKGGDHTVFCTKDSPQMPVLLPAGSLCLAWLMRPLVVAKDEQGAAAQITTTSG